MGLYLAAGGAHLLGTLLAAASRPAAAVGPVGTVEVALVVAVVVGGLVGLAEVDYDARTLAVGAAAGCLLYLGLVWFGLVGVTSGGVGAVEPPWREFAFALVAGPLAVIAAGATRRFLGSDRS